MVADNVTLSKTPQGADIEIIDPTPSSECGGSLVPGRVRINGTEILIPGDATIRIGEISANSFVTATLTVFVRSLSIRHEQA